MANDGRTARVWDLPVRLFHWLLVALVALGLTTGLVAPEWWMGVHAWAGYGIVVLIVFRLFWALFGSQYSRLASFAFAPREIVHHLRGLLLMRPPHYLGHTPSGALMILALVTVLAGIVVSGLLVLGGEENQGPLAGVVGYRIGDAAKDIHEMLSMVLLAMIGGHVLGVLVESRLGGDNLVRAMITGRKRLPAGAPMPDGRRARPVAAALSLAAFALAAGAVLGALAAIPPLGLIDMPRHLAFEEECAECHQLYHPSLLPAASWRGMMAGLQDHFGEDASLDEPTAGDIARHLAAYAAESWDTEAANRFRAVSPGDPWRISATPYWVRKHRDIPEAVFARRSVGGKANCLACHRDAPGGRFDDQRIDIPKE